MVPQGQLAYYTPTPAPPLYQGPPFQFPQSFHTPAASPASSSEPSLYGHPSHPASNVASTAPSSIYPSSSHHTNFTHNAGSEQLHTPSFFLNGGALPCQWQGQDVPPGSSPSPPPYPPGFEPKQDDGSETCFSASSAMGNPSAQPFQPQPQNQPQPHPHALPHPHTHPHAHPHPPSNSHPHLHVHALPQLHQPPPLFSHPHPPSVSHHPSSQTACHTPMLLPSVQTAHLPMVHGFDANGTVIGVPVMGTPVYGDATRAPPPPALPHGQQSSGTLQPKYGQRPMSSGISHQPRTTTFHLTRYFQGNTFHGEDSSMEARRAEQIGWKPSNSQTQRIGKDRHTTSRFWDSGQRPVPPKVDNASLDCCLSVDSNLQPQVPLREFRFGTNGRQPPNTRWGSQAKPSERSHIKSCCPAKEITLPKAQDGYVDGGQEKLSSCQSSKHIGNLQCEIIRDRPDERTLRLNAVQQSSLALACSEAQLSSHVECEETACSGELVKRHEMESASTCEDSRIAPLPSVKNQGNLSRWLQERRQKYPTPANILQKAEERRKLDEMGEFDIDKPKNRLQHIKGGFSKCYHRGQRPRIYNKLKHQEQYIDDNRQVADTGSRDEGAGSCERNCLADSCQSANGSEVAEKEGPIESLSFQGEVTESKKGIHSTDSLSNLISGEIVEQNNHEKTSGPGHVFLFRRKRRRRTCDRSTLGVQRQKQLLFKILDRDIEKETSCLLQCCRFIVNNHFLQGISSLNAKHFEWVGAGKPSSVNNSSSDAMHDLPVCAMHTERPTLGSQEISTEKSITHPQASANDGGQEHTSQGKEDDCQDSNEPCFATVVSAVDDDVLVKDAQHAAALPPQELSCDNRRHELIEGAHNTPLSPPQEISSSGMEQDPILVTEYDDPVSQNRFLNGSHRDKEAPFPWKYSDGYFHQKNFVHGLATRPYDCFREPFCSNGLIADSKNASLLYSSSNLDARGPAPFLREHSTNAEQRWPDHEMDTGEVGSGISDHSLNEDDDILQYMNFDAFETDSGFCFV